MSDIDPEAIRERFLDAVFSTSASLGAALGISGRALYESLAELADDAVLACIAAAESGTRDAESGVIV